MELIDSRFAAFVGVAALLIVTPGPDMALVARNALVGGRRAGACTALGIGIGILGWAIAVALGIAGVRDRSAVAFYALKLAGATYLILLGARALFSGAGWASLVRQRLVSA
jgi:threonine/homoserine/homoserine lactone efflux protein